MLDRLLLPELRLALAECDWDTLGEFAHSLHPRDVAEMLGQIEDPEMLTAAFLHWSAEDATPVFEYLANDAQDCLAERLPDDDLARILERMSHDERADLAKRLRADRLAQILSRVAHAEREDIRRLASYAEGTAGSVMTSDYAAVPADLTVSEAIARLRSEAPDRETIYYLFVLDAERHLVGFISLKDLILAPPFRTIGQVMRTDIIHAEAGEPAIAAARRLAEYDLIAVPIVDEQHRLVGIVTHDDVIDLLQEEATEDIHRMGAVAPIADGYLDASFFSIWRKRTLWLSLLFIAELFTFTAMASFEDAIKQLAVLSLFVPLCLSTGGNSGSQAATLITRAMALGEISPRDWLRVLRHELALGLAMGLALGLIGFCRGFLTPEDTRGSVDAWRLGVVVGQSVAGICLWGTLIGAMLPLIFRRLGADPAFASSPFVATFVDVTGIVIFFTIAKAVLLGPATPLAFKLADIKPSDCTVGLVRRAAPDQRQNALGVYEVDVKQGSIERKSEGYAEFLLVLECDPDAAIEFDGKSTALRPGMGVVVPPGIRWKQRGRMKLLNVASPAYNPKEEWFSEPAPSASKSSNP